MFDTKLSAAIREVRQLPTEQRGAKLAESIEPYKDVVCAYFVTLATLPENVEKCYAAFVPDFLQDFGRLDQYDAGKRFRGWLRTCAESHVIAYWQNLPAEQPKPDVSELLEPYRRVLCYCFADRGVVSQDFDDCFGDFRLKYLLKPGKILQFDSSEGAFRAWICESARNHAIDWLKLKKNRKVQPLESPEQVPGAISELDREFNLIWKRMLLHRALKNVCNQCVREGEERFLDFQVFIAFYTNEDQPRKTWADIADDFNLSSADDASNRAEWVKNQLKKEIRNQVREYASTESQVQQELRDLLSPIGLDSLD